MGLAFLEENGLIYHDLSEGFTRSQSLARFLKSNTRINKKLLGDFLSRPENTEVLKAFVGLFDFRGVRRPFMMYTFLSLLIQYLETYRGCDERTI